MQADSEIKSEPSAGSGISEAVIWGPGVEWVEWEDQETGENRVNTDLTNPLMLIT